MGPTSLKQSWPESVFLVAALISRQWPGGKVSSASQSDLCTGRDAKVFLTVPPLCMFASGTRCI